MTTLDEFLRADLPAATSAADPMAFRIDSMMRIVSIPETAAVLGVEGDRNVNRVAFRAPRKYRDEDLSTFSAQVSYTNAAGESGFYSAGKPRVEGDEVEVSWLVDEPALRYVGDVAFSVKFFAADEKGVVSKQYSTTTAVARCLDGVDADRELPADRLANLEAQLAGAATNAAAKANAAAARADDAATAANSARDAATAAANRAEAAIAQLPLPTGNILRGEAVGKVAHADDAYSATALGLTVYGASTQDGTPTPSAPKQITSVKSADIRIAGKNLFGNIGTRTVSGVTFTQNPDGSVTVKGMPEKQFVHVKIQIDECIGSTITLSCSGTVGSGSADAGAVYAQLTIEAADGKNTNAGLYSNMKELTRTIPPDAAHAFVMITCGADTTQPRNATLKPMLELGAAATAYEPHRASSLAIPLQGHELRSLPNGVKDEVRIDEEGNVELVQRVGKATLDGSEKWRAHASGFVFYVGDFAGTAAANDGKNIMSESLNPLVGNQSIIESPHPEWSIYLYASGENIWCYISSSLSLEAFKARLAAAPSTVYHPLAAPNVIPLGKVAMPTLPAPVANAWVESDVPTECAVRYARDVDMVIGALEKKLAAVATAAI